MYELPSGVVVRNVVEPKVAFSEINPETIIDPSESGVNALALSCAEPPALMAYPVKGTFTRNVNVRDTDPDLFVAVTVNVVVVIAAVGVPEICPVDELNASPAGN
jgi:hypothetical protein